MKNCFKDWSQSNKNLLEIAQLNLKELQDEFVLERLDANEKQVPRSLGPSGSGEDFKGFYHIRHGGQLGHVTRTILTNLGETGAK